MLPYMRLAFLIFQGEEIDRYVPPQTSAIINQTARCHISEDGNLHTETLFIFSALFFFFFWGGEQF
jgi:hypothetical protein